MKWNKDARPRFEKTGGGYWRCREKQKAYYQTERGREKKQGSNARYRATPYGRLVEQLNEMTRIRY